MKKEKRDGTGKKMTLIVPIVLIFCILATFVFYVAGKISKEMSAAAVDNLTESLDLIRGTIEAILGKEAEFQKLIAAEIETMEDPEEFIQSYNRNETMVKLSLVPAGETEGVSNTGEVLHVEDLDFSAGKTIEDLPVSESYLNHMGAWAYTMKCPVFQKNGEAATLYIEYIYESFDKMLPNRFYNGNASLYLMDGDNERLVLKPKGMGEREAGHVNLEDFYRANRILEEEVKKNVTESVKAGKNVMFYHDIQKKKSLIYMWAVNDGSIYLIGYVPIEAIQQEGSAVNQNIFIVVSVMLVAFLICCALYFLTEKQQKKIRREQEQEREIHNRQLAEALQAAQVASKSKTMFLSNMSHDIRTPMNAILGFTTLLAKDVDHPEKVREYTKKIAASGKHLLSLINDVLDVSKIESGKVVLTMAEFTLNNMVSSVDAIIRPAAKAKNQQFEVTVTGVKNECLVGDETRMNQILINLLSNAVKYTQEGGKIWFRIIGMEQRSSQYEHIRIEVEDNGYGMTPEYLETIFDAFTRAENSTTNKVQGTGLGMAITKNIVELMGGTIQVVSEVEKGTLFTVELELRIPEEKVDEQFWKKYEISRILVVDDEEDICKNVQILMDDTGVVVDASLSGEEGISLVEQACEERNPYHVILLDWKMPKMDGIETAKRIRSIVSEHIPILFLTAYDWEDLKEEAVQAGIDGFLAKPFFVSALKEKILEVHAELDDEKIIENSGNSSLEGYHFLVAEDNEINAEILAQLLELEGASCEIAEDGQATLEQFKNAAPGKFDAILMDVQMPNMNGYETTKAIRALNRQDAEIVPIIAMTANAFAEDVRDALDAGMNAHIAKPVDMDLLKKTVSQYIERNKK
ncbi:MAG: response regulator [Lachnospiraceae bacterium]|nr:response regulator [Lachnospiraceae bacterium]